MISINLVANIYISMDKNSNSSEKNVWVSI